ncbi:MAG TPA: NTP transferase domain-containing protein [Syntrophomonadaceae bacterium]|nr:NTP transferase domain-containing protein [Syntrophomonadaceae bacterium]
MSAQNPLVSIVLAGGRGLRLWPESRRQRPKQLCRFINNKTMLDHTLDRLKLAGFGQVLIVTSDDLKPSIANLVQNRDDAEYITILSEPEGKNTAPALGLALAHLYPFQEELIIGVFPADHHVLDTEAFVHSIEKAVQAARLNQVATIGITPDRPETGYGYIEQTYWEVGELPDVYHVRSFCEKPDQPTAKSYVESGRHMWNSGIFIGKAHTFLEEFKQHLPEIHEKMLGGLESYLSSYSYLPDISLDYGIAEKCERIAVVPADFGWSDLGSWEALSELFSADGKNNCINGQKVVALESEQCLIKQEEKNIVLFGVENLLVVESGDVVFIADRNRSQDIRQVVAELEAKQHLDLL